MSESREIPKGWTWSKLDDVCIFYQGYGFPKNLQGQATGDYPFYKVGDISRNVQAGNTYLEFCENHINKDILKKIKAKVSPRNTIVFAKIGEALKLNRRALIKQPGIVDNNAIGLKADSNICNDFFLFHFLNCLKLENYSRATTVPSVRKTDIETVEIPIPPLPEQHRIVAKIEELFSSLDKGIESLKTTQQQLKVYRQAVLKWAFEGKLTEVFRNTNNQLKDVSSILADIRKNRENWFKKKGKKLKLVAEIDSHDLPELPKKWCWVKIVETVLNTADDIVDGPFGSNLKNSDYVDGAPVPVIGISNIEEGFDKKIRYITNEKFETIKRSAVYPGDIIVAKIGSTYGKTGTYPEWMPIGVIPANLLRIRPSEHYSKKLLIHYLQSIVFKKRLDKIMKSTAQPAFNVSMFKDLPIPFMPFEEQNQLVAEIESRLSVCDKIEESIEQSLRQAESLRQSILKKAFEGRLVPQNPNDEPASKLLERIKAEKEKTAIKKRSLK